MHITRELVEKYNQPAPRYTSYPPANHFVDTVTEADYKQLITASNTADPQHIAFYVHIPFCRQICYYCGCNAQLMSNPNSVDKYIQAVKKEIELVLPLIDKSRKVSQIHYGGGTPNAIEARYLKEINELLFREFDMIDRPEVAIEAHPGLLDYEYVDALFDAGFNRFSFGIQDFNEQILKNVNRRPSALPMDELVAYVRKNPLTMGVNLDFIYGLTGQTVESFSESMHQAIAVKPDRLVTFSYAHVPWLKEHMKILTKRGLPSPDDKMGMFLAAYKILTEGGYDPIGFDHYALPEDELSVALNNKQLHRNFQGYCTRRTTGQVYAFGVSGISQLSGGYIQNTKDIFKYKNLLDDGHLPIEKGILINPEQRIIREVINELMCNQYLNWHKLGEKLQISPDILQKTVGYKRDKLFIFEQDGLLNVDDDQLQVTENGSFFIRNIAATFDPAFKLEENKYSKSV